jgi:glyoxylase-like metal-dependent hydrolase (beta-lactamase superfamily II)
MRGLLRRQITKGGFGPERVAEGVWRVQGMPGRMNVYFVEHDGGLVQFDAGGRCMLDQVRAAVAQLGTLREVVLGHGHTDHRGTAPYLGVPVRCHAHEVQDAEGSGGWRYWGDLAAIEQPRRFLHKRVLHPRFWDGGPVRIAGTLAEGDDVAGFEVVHLPGHAPGQITLLRRADGVALTTDAFYSIDDWGRDSPPHVPGDYYNLDTQQARASLRRLAELPITVAWPGHGEPLRGDVRSQLLAAAEACAAQAAHSRIAATIRSGASSWT